MLSLGRCASVMAVSHGFTLVPSEAVRLSRIVVGRRMAGRARLVLYHSLSNNTNSSLETQNRVRSGTGEIKEMASTEQQEPPKN